MTVNNLKVGFIGGGNMATAIIGGILRNKSGTHSVLVCEPSEQRRTFLKSKFEINLLDSSKELVGHELDAIIVAVKPNIAKGVFVNELQPIINQKWSPPIISIVVGITIQTLRGWINRDFIDIVRTMPNTPSLIGEGVIAAYTEKELDPTKKALFDKILGSVTNKKGLVWMDKEDDLNTVVPLSGSSPAYFFYIIETMSKIAQEYGYDQETSTRLAALTMLGSAKMILEGEETPRKLRQNVCSPNGATLEAMNVIIKNDFENTLRSAFSACIKRSIDIGQEISKL